MLEIPRLAGLLAGLLTWGALATACEEDDEEPKSACQEICEQWSACDLVPRLQTAMGSELFCAPSICASICRREGVNTTCVSNISTCGASDFAPCMGTLTLTSSAACD